MKISVFGGAGFIGSHICTKLIGLGHEVVCIDNLQAGYTANIIHLQKSDRFKFYKIDITDKAKLESSGLFEWADVVINQAASKKNICLKNPHKDLEINGGGILTLLQLSVKYGIKKFIHASTGSVYGEVEGIITENTPLNPVSYYGVSKLAGERYVNMFHNQYDLDTTILRYFHVYGSRQESKDDTGGVIAIFECRLKAGLPLIVYGDGTQIRSFTHVKDIVTANIESLINPISKGKVYNVASGVRISLKQMILELAKHLKKPLNIEYMDWMEGDIMNFYVDNMLIKYDLNIDFETKLRFDK